MAALAAHTIGHGQRCSQATFAVQTVLTRYVYVTICRLSVCRRRL